MSAMTVLCSSPRSSAEDFAIRLSASSGEIQNVKVPVIEFLGMKRCQQSPGIQPAAQSKRNRTG